MLTLSAPRQITEKEKKQYVRHKIRKERIKCCISAILNGWKGARHMSTQRFFSIWIDMIVCGVRYTMPCRCYKAENVFNLSNEKRNAVGKSILHQNKEKYARQSVSLNWYREYVNDRKFQIRYTTKWWDKTPARKKRRLKAYQQRYNMGEDCVVQYDVDLNREHYLEGSIKMGDHVLLAKHVFIDYSGEIVIDDNVKIANGVIIESHYRDMEAYDQGRDVNIPTKLHICENAYIGSRAMILSSCHYIGKHARVGAGAVVTKDVPDYATVVGVPAKVIKVNAPTISTETN